jgi:predicted transcriptional regulator
MTARRSKFQISIEVLEAISHGEFKPTRLMYACNLSWSSMKDVLGLLETKGYIEDLSSDGKRKQLGITGKGTEILGYYDGLENLVQISVV